MIMILSDISDGFICFIETFISQYLNLTDEIILLTERIDSLFSRQQE